MNKIKELEDKVKTLEQEKAALIAQICNLQYKTPICYGCGEETNGPGHDDCERDW